MPSVALSVGFTNSSRMVHAEFIWGSLNTYLDSLASSSTALLVSAAVIQSIREGNVNRRNLPRAASLGAAAIVVALGLSACSASNESDDPTTSGSSALSGELNGAGSTAQEAAMAAWKAGFQSANPDVTVNYDAVGSGGGVDQFLSGGVQFAGSDAYLSDDQANQAKDKCGAAGAVEYPVYVSPIAVIYNLQGVDNLQLSPDTLTDIFTGKITSWDDPAIKSDNPGVDLPSSAISPVHRSDESGTTANFTNYLSAAAPKDWTYGTVESWPIKSGEAADGTSGVVSAVKSGSGTIGYADASQAGDLGKASVKVGSNFVGPSADAASKVLDESKPAPGASATNVIISVNRTPTGSGVYPIVLVSYQILCSSYDSSDTVNLVKGFADFVVSEAGQQAASQSAGSAPITDSIRSKAQAAIDTVTTSS